MDFFLKGKVILDKIKALPIVFDLNPSVSTPKLLFYMPSLLKPSDSQGVQA
jgi:hypothetical protein